MPSHNLQFFCPTDFWEDFLKIPKNVISSESSPLKGGRGPYLRNLNSIHSIILNDKFGWNNWLSCSGEEVENFKRQINDAQNWLEKKT